MLGDGRFLAGRSGRGFLKALAAIALAGFLCGGHAAARTRVSVPQMRPSVPAAEIPEALRSWTGWTMHGQDAWLCPEVAGERRADFCAWPGVLRLEVREGGARFAQTWELLRARAVTLPGSREYWPQQVTVDGRPYPVSRRGDGPEGAPVVWLPPGRHAVAGWIPWAERPGKLNVPEHVALIALSVDGKAVQPLERNGTALALGADEAARVREEDSVDVQVYRRLADDIPARLTTRVHLKVSGKAREVAVADVLPGRFVPVGVFSPWAARLDRAGHLRVQALPGEATVEIEARLDEPLVEVRPRLSPQRPQEVWSYEAKPEWRTTTIRALADGEALPVDPRQAGVPEAWLNLPALAVGEGARLRVEEHARGEQAHASQRLTLRREMWLDFSGRGFFARDRIEGQMRQGWRFDVARPYRLVSANRDMRPLANAVDQAGLLSALLVTRGAEETLTGVEWRGMEVTLNAGVRLEAEAGAHVPVTGWRQTFDSVETTLHLPYGYRLLAAPGVDAVSGNAWVERWTVLDVFLAAFFALLAWRLFGTRGGLAAAAYLVLAMPEPMAPVYSFAAAAALALLHRFVPEGRLRRALRIGQGLALLYLAFAAVLFVPGQIRAAIYPQLEESSGRLDGEDRDVYDLARAEALAELAAEEPSSDAEAEENAMKPAHRARSKQRASSLMQAVPAPAPPPRYAQSSVTQTGGGEPAWNLGERYRLRWAGPVTEARHVQLVVSPPWLTRLLRLLTVVLLGTLVWRLARDVLPPGGRCAGRAGGRTASRAGVGLAVLLVAALGLPLPVAAAEAFPSRELLGELKERLSRLPDCAPACADIADARVQAAPRLLRVGLTAHAAAPASLPLPEPGKRLDMRAVRVGDAPHSVLRFKGKNYIVLPRGIHRVQIDYVPDGERVSLDFPLRPARIEFAGTGWRAEGIDENRLPGGTLNLSRTGETPAAAGERDAQAQQFAPFVHVDRNIDLDLDWRATTQVSRLAPVEEGFTFPIPLLAGEHVTTPAVKVQEGHALAVFSARAATVSWTARLDRAETLELVAPPLTERAETWRIAANPSWHVEWNGVPVRLDDDWEERAAFEFHPLPGEKLVLKVSQPATVEGAFLAIDEVVLQSHVGQHASDHDLHFTLRASRGGEHRIGLPPELEVLEVRRDGTLLNVQAREGRLTLPVSPGRQTYVLGLRHVGEIGPLTASPAIDLGLLAANIHLRTALGEQRWILATSGPAAGPALLYWGELLAALVVAFLLARGGWGGLGRWEWFLLVLGFSTFSWTTLLLVALWLLVIDWRACSGAHAHWPPLKFDAMQAGLLVLTAIMLWALVAAVPHGLLGAPDMGIRGQGSDAAMLSWFADQGGQVLPVVRILSLPIWVYRLLMLAWALWLAYSLVRWLGRGLAAWLRHGYWRPCACKAHRKGAAETAAARDGGQGTEC
ncbi:MAG: hypothetical protein LBP86_04760 [Azoarcus sp.]|jgi:hypothetical protein|nr:hypothetical protein [Azoarcus sp.]